MGVWQDLRFAVRLLIKERWFTAVAAIALALGIAVNTAVFTFVNAVLIRGLPFDEPDRIIALGTTDARGRQLGVSRLDFQDWRDSARSFSGLVLFLGAPMNISEETLAPEQVGGTYGASNMFQMIGQRPIMGRDFTAQDDRPDGEPVVIISNGVWKNRYGGDANILGRVIRINSLPCTIIGVMPPDMRFPFNNDVWMPLSKLPPGARDTARGVRNFTAFGRLAKDVTLEQARVELETIGAQLARDYPATNKEIRPTIVSYNDRVTGPQIRLMFLSMMGAVVFVLLIACANVANLLLARAAQRSREIAVRVSLGAGRWRIIRQLLIESILLASLSGVLGLGLAIVGIRAFDATVTTDVGKPYWMTFTLDPIVFGFLALVCLATGIVFGLAPALHISRTNVNEVLKEAGGRSGTGGIRARRWTSALITVEIALTLVLLAGAGFMMRSFFVLYRSDLGFDSQPLLTARLFLPLTKYPKAEQRAIIGQQIEERLGGNSAFQSVALTTNTPGFGGFMRQMTIDGKPEVDPARRPEVTMVAVSSRYFETLGLRVARGRDFNRDDGLPGHEAVIVNQRLVGMHFAGEDPIGRRVTLFDPNPGVTQAPPISATIVGIVPAIRQRNFQEPDADPVAFLPHRADPQRGLMLVVRVPGDPARVSQVVRDEMRALEPDLPLVAVQTMNQLLAQQRFMFRVFGTTFGIFAAIALVLSAVGLYAVTAYSVTQRTSEIGVRMALGAQSTQVMWLVLKRSLLQLAIGLPLGIAGAFGVGRLLQTMLVQTSARDPLTIASIAAVMIGVSLAACFWPARQATRLDPVSALRYE
jgi:putative ABC transport system permease protein